METEKCPPELVELAQKIVKRCEGIPFAIAAVGSLMSRINPLPSNWEKVHDNLGTEIDNCSRDQTITKMLLPTYKDLPSNLKSCFLYFSLFPEDYSVGRARLVRLWVAEGFVKETGNKSLEEIAEDYLNELIGRHLVHANSRDIDGRVKSCRVLNLVREFAVTKSKEESFAVILTRSGSTNSWEKVRRLSIHKSNLENIRGKADLQHVRTLSAYGVCENIFPRIRLTLDECKLLRVLDLHRAPLQQFPECITQLTLLRLISLRHTNVRDVPESIQALRYLEYLDLKHTHVTVLPKGIGMLHKLRHLLVHGQKASNSITFHDIIGARMLGAIGALLSLQELTLIKANNDKNFFNELGHLDQLQKLGLIGLKAGDGKHLCVSIQKMLNLSVLDLSSSSKEKYLDLDFMSEFSRNLQRLYLKGRLDNLPIWVNTSLSSLVRIQLKWSKLEESPVERLQFLPNLMELQMVDAFVGDLLFFDTGSFRKLKILHIQQFCHLETVVVLCGAMPELQKLIIVNCSNLKMLPDGIAHLTSLEELRVYNMPPEFTNRLKKDDVGREMIKHIAEIRAFTLDAHGYETKSENFS